MQIWVLARWFFVIDAASIMTPPMKVKLVILTFIGIFFFGGVGRNQISQDIDRSAQEQIHADNTAIAVINSKLEDKERRIEVLEAKVDIVKAQGDRFAAKQEQADEKLSWLVRICGAGILALVANFFHDVWERTMRKREGIRNQSRHLSDH